MRAFLGALQLLKTAKMLILFIFSLFFKRLFSKLWNIVREIFTPRKSALIRGFNLTFVRTQIRPSIGSMSLLLFEDAHSAAIRVGRSLGRHVGVSFDLVEHVLYCDVKLRITAVDH